MAAEHTREGRFNRYSGGIILFAVIVSYFADPLMRLANPIALAVGGFGIGLFSYTVYEHAVNGEKLTKWGKRRWIAAIVFFTGLVVISLSYACGTSIKLDRICADLQRAMLSGRPGTGPALPGKAEAPDTFQALGCRPQFGLLSVRPQLANA